MNKPDVTDEESTSFDEAPTLPDLSHLVGSDDDAERDPYAELFGDDDLERLKTVAPGKTPANRR